MKRIRNVYKSEYSADFALIISLVLAGGFYEFASALIGAAVSVMLIVRIFKSGKLRLRINPAAIAVFVTAFFFLITVFWAVDYGSALIGFVRFLPVVLFMLLVTQDGIDSDSVLSRLPYYALATGLISVILMFVPAAGDYFGVAGRLSGPFQYPNTLAAFLLTGELILLTAKKKGVKEILMIAALAVFIVLTGSRAVIALAIIANVTLLLINGNKRARLITAGAVLILAVLAFALYPVLGSAGFFARFYRLSFFESTFAGRLLYWSDALPLVLKNPLGIGYMGYYYMEQGIQSGVYSVKFVHNDLLQLLLDIGWVPFAAFVCAVVAALTSRRLSVSRKVILGVVLLHAMFDLDLQFTSMCFVLILLLDIKGGRDFELKKRVTVPVLAAAGLVSVYFAAGLSLCAFGLHSISDAVMPFNTENKVELLSQESNADAREELADSILAQNSRVVAAQAVKAENAYSQGDFEQLIKCENKISELAPFEYDECVNYAYMLINGITLYSEAGDARSAQTCVDELIALKERVEGVKKRLSDLGKIIKDQPKTALPKGINEYIKELGELIE